MQQQVHTAIFGFWRRATIWKANKDDNDDDDDDNVDEYNQSVKMLMLNKSCQKRWTFCGVNLVTESSVCFVLAKIYSRLMTAHFL